MKNIFLIVVMGVFTVFYAQVIKEEFDLVQSIIPNTKIKKVEKTPIDGLYIVMMGNEKFIYVYPFKKLIFFGEIMDNKGRNITEYLKKNILAGVDDKGELVNINKMKNLPTRLKIAEKVVYGEGGGDYEIILITDPDCPFCVSVDNFLSKKDIVVYYLFNPITELHPKARNKVLWMLQKDKELKAQIKLLREGAAISEQDHSKDNPAVRKLNEMQKLVKDLGISGTPILLIKDIKENTIIDIIKGADMKKLSQYMRGSK